MHTLVNMHAETNTGWAHAAHSCGLAPRIAYIGLDPMDLTQRMITNLFTLILAVILFFVLFFFLQHNWLYYFKTVKKYYIGVHIQNQIEFRYRKLKK